MRRSPIISPADLGRLMESRADLVILDARPDASAYDAAHLRGALRADLNSDLSDACTPGFDPRHGGRHPLPSPSRWAATLGGWGIGPGTPVVVYDELDGSNAAARAWWMLRAAGHADAAVLDGGFRAAQEAGLPLSSGSEQANPRQPYPVSRWLLPTADLREVDGARLAPDRMVLDVRSAPRFRGETEPIDPVAGHIPGAVNLWFGENVSEGRFRSAEELKGQYERLLGGVPAERLIVHCGSGVTACHTLLALEAAGLHGASLYVGSWSEWCRNDLPRDPAGPETGR